MKGEKLFAFFIGRLIDPDVTLLSLVHVKNILFDSAFGLLISQRNEGIRYSEREKTQKRVKLKLTYELK